MVFHHCYLQSGAATTVQHPSCFCNTVLSMLLFNKLRKCDAGLTLLIVNDVCLLVMTCLYSGMWLIIRYVNMYSYTHSVFYP